jgi:crotonobetainyl-CoA:carnitine CoA-transferase CaiB-like acyl-CoA transferase
LRVLDLSWGMPGAVASMLLCDNGAEVIHVVRPSDAERPGTDTFTWDRGKRSIVLDLRDDGDRAVLRSLARGADVLIDGLRPGHLTKLGFGPDEVRADNPTVVYCSLTGLESDELPGYDALAAARYGVMAESPGHRDGPIFPGHPAVDYGTALVAVIGILAAIRARLDDGRGDRLEVGFQDGVLSQLGMNWRSERGLSFIAQKSRTGTLDMGHRRLLLNRYVCSDGKIVQIHTGAAGAFGRAMRLFGLDGEISPAEAGVETGSLLTDHDLDVLRVRLPEIFRSKTSEEWQRLCWDSEVACLPVQAPGVVFDDDQIRHAGVMIDLDHPELGPIEAVGPVIKLSETPGRASSKIPAPDEDGSAIRDRGWLSPGFATPSGDAVAPADGTARRPLTGIRIVEFANWFASPYGNRLLSDLGADVVKVEPLVGDLIRPLPDPCEGANGGKRSLAMDVKADGAAEVLAHLFASADVVQHNLRPGVAERIGIDYDTVRSINAAVVYGYAPGYGSTGPKAKLQSFAPLLSGFVGLMQLAAGPGNEPHVCFGNEDYYNGLLSAAGIILGLVHRERTGTGQSIETPQLHSSVLVTSEWYKRHGELRSTLPTLDHEQTGWGPFYRVYQCLEGWLCVACGSDDQADDLVRQVLGEDASAAVAEEPIGERLAYEFYGQPAPEWETQLRAAGVPCEVVLEESWLHEFLGDDANLATGRAQEIDHPTHGRARTIGQIFRLASLPVLARPRSPMLGEHSREVLHEIGFDDERVEGLIQHGTVRTT